MTLEQERRVFRKLVEPLGRVRIKLDGEGWPFVPGRYGRLEWRGKEQDGRSCVYAYTDRKKMLTKIRAVSTPVQVGDTEGAFRCETPESLGAVAALLQLKRKRAPETGRNSDFMALIRPTISSQETT